jgi:ankyrin repeat protein
LVLIARGADINCRDNDEQTPLFWTCFNGRTDTAFELLSRGVYISTKHKYRGTPTTPLYWSLKPKKR